MHHDEFAKILLSDERRKWQNADKVISQLEIKNYFQICDLGCGPGYFTLAFAKKVGKRGKVFAVDSNPKMLELLRTQLLKLGKRNVELICSDVVSTGLPDATMDIAFFANVLHDIAEKREFLREVKRICKSQAKVVDVDWDKDKASEQGPPAYMRLSEDEALQLFEKEGFRLEKKIYGGEFHYGLLFSLK
jgi:ubiquinone/menaquinone biosynthesis C-methylase UbiE